MAGVSDEVFRGICVEIGCALTYTEMISAKGLYYNSESTKKLLRMSGKEKPAAVQLFGSEPEIIGCITQRICKEKAKELALIDLNMGCPAPKIVKNGEGSALMKDIPLAAKVIRAAVKASSVPVTVKFRKGWDNEHVNAVEFAKMAEESGAAAVAVHGRTREQFYGGRADIEIIAEVKDKINIPVIGNGDIFDAYSAKNMLEYTKCDAVMVARGAQGNPFIFAQINALLNEQQIVLPSKQEKIDTALLHAQGLCALMEEKYAIRYMRKHIAWYTKGIEGAAKIRNKINSANTLLELRIILSEL